MMVWLALLLLLQTPAPNASRAEAERLFQLGNDLYAEGDFSGAAAAYEGAAATGWTSLALHLNLGNAYLEAGAVGRAVLHIERAARIAPRDAHVRHNLRRVRQHVAGAASARAASPVGAAVQHTARTVGAVPLTVVLFVLWTATAGLVGYRLWTGTRPVWVRRALVVLVPLVLILGTFTVTVAHAEARPRAVVLTAEAPVRAEPNTAAMTRAVAAEGQILTIRERRRAWRAVRLPDGTAGWAEAAALEEI